MLTAALLLLTGHFPLVEAFLQSESAAPSMVVHLPPQDAATRVGFVIGAPHDGYDRHTGVIAREVARQLTAPAVVASGYRKTSAGRFLNVNRPTGSKVSADGKLGPEAQSCEASEVYRAWLCKVESAKESAAIPKGEPVPMYIEIHGHNRSTSSGGKKVVVNVIEVATLGFPIEELQALHRHWNELRQTRPSLPPIFFDALHPSYEHGGTTVKFKYRAQGAKSSGILRPQYVERALHFELPPDARNKKQRRVTAEAIATLLAEIRVK